jgi:transposase
MYFMGIDWADEKHDICVLDPQGKVIREFDISHDQRGFDILRKRIARLDDAIKINIERSDGLLVDWLVRNGYAVHLTPPLSLHHRRPRRSKNDKGDAYLLAHLLRIEDPECRLLAQRSDLVEKLRQLLRAYDDMVQEQRRQGNRLIYLLKQYYPAAVKLFCQREATMRAQPL